jgi:hypothetical protein
MRRTLLCVVATLAVSGAFAIRPAAADDCTQCASLCQAQGYDDGVCSIPRPDRCVCIYIG